MRPIFSFSSWSFVTLLVLGVLVACSGSGGGTVVDIDPTGGSGGAGSGDPSRDGGPCVGPGCSSSCVKKTCADLGANCGTVSDGCGGTLDCGGCAAPATCGAGGQANVCAVAGCSGTWTTDAVDTTFRAWDVGGGNIAVDDKGGVHLAYGTPGPIRYAYRAPGGAWSTSSLPEGGWNVAIAVDDKGGVHVSYADQSGAGSTWKIRYASRAAGASAWTTVTVDDVGSVVQDTTAIGLDAQGGVFIRYLGPSATSTSSLRGSLMVAHRPAGGAFTKTQVAPDAVSPGTVATGGRALTVDAAGGVHVVFFAAHDYLSYAHKPKGGAWSVASLDTSASNLSPAQVAVDKKGDVHVGYLGQTSRSVRRAHKPAGGAWSTHPVDSSTSQIFDVSLAVDDAQGIHVAYKVDSTLRYAKTRPGSTSYDFFNYVDSGVEEPRVAVDRSGGVHVAYRDEVGKRVKYGYRCPGACPAKSCAAIGADCGSRHDGCNIVTCGACSEATLCGAGGVANKCCVPKTCASAGATCGAISDGCGRMLSCGGCQSPLECGTGAANACGACVSGHINTDLVYGIGDVGRASSIAVDATGGAHVAFSDDTNADLLYAHHPAGQPWSTTVVDPSASLVWGTATRVDATGRVHVLYSVRDANTLEIRYATRAGGAGGAGAWQRSLVASRSTNLSTNVALALDAAGALHAAYYDGQTNSIAYAVKPPGAAWSITTAAAAGDDNTTPGGYGELVSLALDAAGGVHIAHSRTSKTTNDAVVHTHKPAGGAFTSESVIESSNLHKQTSIAVDAAGTVHLSYSTTNAVYVAAKPEGGSFTSTWIENGDRVESAVGVDASGKVHLFYYDDKASVRVLKYASSSGAGFTKAVADTQKPSGRAPALAIDATGGLHVSYVGGATTDLKYAYRCP